MTRPLPNEPPAIPRGWFAVALAASAAAVLLLLADARIGIDPWTADNRDVLLCLAIAAVTRLSLRAPRGEMERIVRDLAEYLGLFVLICLMGAVASYPAAAVGHGLYDAPLERVDRLLRFDWVGWYSVVAAHPALQRAGEAAYDSIYLTPAAILAFFAWTGREAAARRFIASFWLAAVTTLALFMLMPAEGPLAFLWHRPIAYMPVSALYQAQLIPLLRHHAVQRLDLAALHGLVCAPSFHTTSAVLFIAAAWPFARLRAPVTLVNIAMLVATPVEGTHYLTDMICGAIVAVAALQAVGALCARLGDQRAGSVIAGGSLAGKLSSSASSSSAWR